MSSEHKWTGFLFKKFLDITSSFDMRHDLLDAFVSNHNMSAKYIRVKIYCVLSKHVC